MLFIVHSAESFSQEKDIVPYLKLIESGQKDSVQKMLPDLQKSDPDDPSILYLKGILTENGQDAVPVFNRILTDFPRSKYADASVYRLYSYYYSLGLYKTASVFLDKLKKNYPASPYIKIAEKELPAEDETTSSESSPIIDDNHGDYKYTIQAGAFSEDSNATALKKQFEDSGYHSFIKKKTVGGSEFSVVFVGEFKQRNEADDFLQLVNKQFKLNGRIVPMDQ